MVMEEVARLIPGCGDVLTESGGTIFRLTDSISTSPSSVQPRSTLPPRFVFFSRVTPSGEPWSRWRQSTPMRQQIDVSVWDLFDDVFT